MVSSVKKSSDHGRISASKRCDCDSASAGATETSLPLNKKVCPCAVPTE